MGRRNDKWEEVKGPERGVDPAERCMWTDRKMFHFETNSAAVKDWRVVSILEERTGRPFFFFCPWRDGKMFLISGLNHPADKKMLLSSSGNEKQKCLLHCACWERDNGAIVAAYNHGCTAWHDPVISHWPCTVCEGVHTVLWSFLPICIWNQTEQVEVIWFRERVCEWTLVNVCVCERSGCLWGSCG